MDEGVKLGPGYQPSTAASGQPPTTSRPKTMGALVRQYRNYTEKQARPTGTHQAQTVQSTNRQRVPPGETTKTAYDHATKLINDFRANSKSFVRTPTKLREASANRVKFIKEKKQCEKKKVDFEKQNKEIERSGVELKKLEAKNKWRALREKYLNGEDTSSEEDRLNSDMTLSEEERNSESTKFKDFLKNTAKLSDEKKKQLIQKYSDEVRLSEKNISSLKIKHERKDSDTKNAESENEARIKKLDASIEDCDKLIRHRADFLAIGKCIVQWEGFNTLSSSVRADIINMRRAVMTKKELLTTSTPTIEKAEKEKNKLSLDIKDPNVKALLNFRLAAEGVLKNPKASQEEKERVVKKFVDLNLSPYVDTTVPENRHFNALLRFTLKEVKELTNETDIWFLSAPKKPEIPDTSILNRHFGEKKALSPPSYAEKKMYNEACAYFKKNPSLLQKMKECRELDRKVGNLILETGFSPPGAISEAKKEELRAKKEELLQKQQDFGNRIGLDRQAYDLYRNLEKYGGRFGIDEPFKNT